MRTKLRLIIALLTFALVAAMPLSQAWASSGDLDEILAYDITVDVNEDATLNMVYHIEWKVLDSTSDGPLSWVRVGIPNKHYNEMVGLNDTVKRIAYDSSGGSYARIDLDRKYYAGEVASFDFKLVQDYMYQVGRDNQGEAVFEFTPGWFDDIVVDSLKIKWKSDKVDRIAPAALQSKGYYTWETSLRKGGRYTVTVAYPDDAFDFDINKTIENGMTKGSYEDEEDSIFDVLAGLFILGIFWLIIWGFYRFIKSIVLAAADAFAAATGFTTGKKTGKKITRTKVVYYPTCPGCGAARPDGKDTCEYCGRSLVKSEEVVSEEDIPAEEQSLKRKDTDGEYAYSTLPDTFLRVHVVPVPVVSHSTSRHRSSGSSRSCACASSCACACGCACACACAGGGRAGCTTKDFYRTDLKLSQLERSAGAGENR